MENVKVKKRDLIYTWGMPIIGFPTSSFLIVIGWVLLNSVSVNVIIFALFFFLAGIVGLCCSILMLINAKKGIIEPMFIK